jgi:ferrous-iron efflux pump FieF
VLQRRVERTQSAIRADALHFATDLLTNGAVILIVFGRLRLGWPMPCLPGIAAYIFYSALHIGHKRFSN